MFERVEMITVVLDMKRIRQGEEACNLVVCLSFVERKLTFGGFSCHFGDQL